MEKIKVEIGRPRCRFDLFVRYKPEIVNKKGIMPQFTYRGDRFTDEPPQMLKSLLRFFCKRAGEFTLIILYDNTKPKGEPGHEILRIRGNVVEVNLLKEYSLMLTGIYFPALLPWQK